MPAQGTQFLRKASLVVVVGNDVIDLSELRFRFASRQSDVQTPNSLFVRIYNLSDATRNKIIGPGGNTEFKQVTLQAGYMNAQYGLVFQGTIKQTRRGRENETETYLDILASDSDLAINFSVINKSLIAGASPNDIQSAVFSAMQGADPTLGMATNGGLAGGTLPRGKVMFGMARDVARDLAKSTGTFWSIQNGKYQMITRTAYLPGTSVVLNSKSGMLNVPQQTEQGVEVQCLLNPLIVIGSIVKIDNASINQTVNQSGAPIAYDSYTDIQLLADVSADGNYRAYVVEHSGDTRGEDWTTHVVGLAIDLSAPVASAVPAGAF